MSFNPFDKPIDELTAEDMPKLVEREVTEGWVVEFKRELPANPKVGRSIASLANTYGGWYIVGVTTDGHNKANEVPGFDATQCPDPTSKVREIIKSHITPTPLFFIRVVTLDSGRLVLVVEVPGGQDTPFVTSDGRIHRRIADSSDPVSESDRHAVDRLIDRGRESRQIFAGFCQDDRTFSKAESEQSAPGWAVLYFAPYPNGIVEPRWGRLTASGVEAALARSRQPLEIYLRGQDDEEPLRMGSGNIPFTSRHATIRAMILRQTDPRYLGRNSLTLELGCDGWTKMFIPLHLVKPCGRTPSGAAESVHSPAVRRVLEEYGAQDAEGWGMSLARFIDMAQCWQMITLLVNFYRDWLGEQPTMSDIRFAASVSNVWRAIPFVDDDEWAIQVEKLGMPIVMQSTIQIPGTSSEGVLMRYDESLWFHLCQAVTGALGLSPELLRQSMIGAASSAPTDGSEQADPAQM